ncbi:signal transduction histidine kinase (STHK), LytS [Oscillatoria laete-virens NRMC-F 0139]|nr:general stress protein [Oscillatoria laete-virens]MDL5051988.1 signal transduction histidine kinase (STHK), LytS [Oscillatoria laete-virens NRMC-F 0139]
MGCKSVFGIFSSRVALERAVDGLKVAGFSSNDISILYPDNTTSRELATEKNTKAPEGAATGAGAGAVVGGALGWLAGIGALAIPGVGPFIAAGPIMAALAGAGIGGAAGGLTGGLVGAGIPEYEAKRYAGRISKGGFLLSVHSDNSDEIDVAKKVMENSGGEDIATASEAKADIKVQ